MNRGFWKKRYSFRVPAGLLLVLLFLTGCAVEDRGRPVAETAEEAELLPSDAPAGDVEIGARPEEEPVEDVVILYTNDTHGAADDYLGFAGVAALKKELLKTTPNVLLVDCGDHTQGSSLAAVSKGLYPVQIMNKAGYDYATLGTHEFDYGLKALQTNMMAAQYQYLCCNVTYTGKETDPLFGLKPYEIVDLGGRKIALIGVTREKSMIRSDNGETLDSQLIDFHSESAEELAACVQSAVDECLQQGASNVILLSHLGDAEEGSVTSAKIIENTTGIDVVLDGYSHSVIPEETLPNKAGEPVILSSTGCKLETVGKLVLNANGTVTAELILETPQADPETSQYIRSVRTAYEKDLQVRIGSSEVDLVIAGEDGVPVIRSRETNLGDLCADALRSQMGGEIAVKNAASIQGMIPAGDITRNAVLEAQPFDTDNVLIRTSGQHILEALEYGARLTQKKYKNSEGEAIGTFKGFLQVSGLRFTIDTSVESSVTLDSEDCFVSLGETHRVKDVKVESEDGTLTPLDPEQEYTLAVSSYLAVEGGGGFTMFMDDEVLDTGGDDYTLLSQYIEKKLGGVIPEQYREPQGRIKIK